MGDRIADSLPAEMHRVDEQLESPSPETLSMPLEPVAQAARVDAAQPDRQLPLGCRRARSRESASRPLLGVLGTALTPLSGPAMPVWRVSTARDADRKTL